VKLNLNLTLLSMEIDTIRNIFNMLADEITTIVSFDRTRIQIRKFVVNDKYKLNIDNQQ
jgi:hypothetical protein